MEKLLVGVLAQLETDIEEAKAAIKHFNLPEIKANKQLLRLLFQNLIQNAIKFRSSERQLEVNINCSIEEDQILIRCIDNGIGIAEENFEQIFELFKRLHTKDEIPGTGIGLANCKRIVELHGGNIWVESIPQKGSAFCFTLAK